MDLIDRVRRTIARHELAGETTRVVAAVSGGSDSVALVRLLLDLHDAGDLRLVGIAHFNHQLRNAADEDERFCAGLAAALQLPFSAGRADVRALARAERWSIERAARAARLAFLDRAREELAADRVAVGHTRDDQAETFLLRLLRGAGSRGLAAMHPRNGRIIRPLLDCRRSELQALLASRSIPFRDDETNQDVSIPRNRVRHELLPLLVDRFNPAVVEALADSAALARDEHRYLAGQADRWIAEHVQDDGALVRFDAAALLAAPAAVARLAVWRVLERPYAVSVRFADVERTLAVACGERTSFDAPRQRVERIGGEVVLTKRAPGERGRPEKARSGSNLFGYALSIPGEVRIPEVGCSVSAEVVERGFEVSRGQVHWAAVPFDKTKGGLQVRNRRPGDRFWPLGAPGRTKLQDFFTDRKVARERRDAVPIVVDASNRIVWVAGHAIDEAFRVTDPAQAVIILRLKGVGGSV